MYGVPYELILHWPSDRTSCFFFASEYKGFLFKTMPRTKPKQKKGNKSQAPTNTNPFEIRKQHVKKQVLNSRTRGTTQQVGKARALAETRVNLKHACFELDREIKPLELSIKEETMLTSSLTEDLLV